MSSGRARSPYGADPREPRPDATCPARRPLPHDGTTLAAPKHTVAVYAVDGFTDDTVDVQVGERRARAALMLMLALPGGVYLYQGEELGLPQVDLPDDQLQDPVFVRSGGAERGRDGCRIPRPWTGGDPPYGFTDAPSTWLPQPPGWGPYAASRQRDDPTSMLSFYRRATRIRSELRTSMSPGLEWISSPPGTLAFTRSAGFRCLVNLSSEPVSCSGRVVLASAEMPDGALPPDAAAWVVDENGGAVGARP